MTAAAVIVVIAPDEASLGATIKTVYVHVMFTVTGRIGLTLVGVLGLWALVRNSERVETWAQHLGWIALGAFVIGIITSMISAMATWGGVFWQEPRLMMALQIASVAIIVQVACSWLDHTRLRAVLHMALAVIVTWLISTTGLRIHPANPITNSDATGIQLTFTSLILIGFLTAGWIFWQWERLYTFTENRLTIE